jgi:hypothetical protein
MRFIPGKNFLSFLNILFIFFSLLDREKDRQIDRETEKQRDRETKRQRNRETDRQIDRETERQIPSKAG